MDNLTAPSSITVSNDSLSLSFVVCKYRMPCGYCELKKEQCKWWQDVSMPYDDNKFKITPTWSPNLNEVTCDAKG